VFCCGRLHGWRRCQAVSPWSEEREIKRTCAHSIEAMKTLGKAKADKCKAKKNIRKAKKNTRMRARCEK
jgi:hypothetical protein